jgi:hypothetical protein
MTRRAGAERPLNEQLMVSRYCFWWSMLLICLSASLSAVIWLESAVLLDTPCLVACEMLQIFSLEDESRDY